jgi:hypothetical protein
MKKLCHGFSCTLPAILNENFRFEVLIVVFWVVMPRLPPFWGNMSPNLHPKDGDNSLLLNTGIYEAKTVSEPRRLQTL